MSAAVCGSKRCLFDDVGSPPSPTVSKKMRRWSSSSTSQSQTPSTALLDRLLALFPQLDPQILESTLEECANDVDAAIRRLQESAAEETGGSVENYGRNMDQGTFIDEENIGHNCYTPNNSSSDGQWVDSFVKEMISSTSLEDARIRAARALEVLEQSVSSRAGAEAVQGFQKENLMLKEQSELLLRENSILKRAVSIQHDRQRLYEDNNQESQHLNHLASHCQEQIRVLEVNNYALTMHLRQAQQNNTTFPGHRF